MSLLFIENYRTLTGTDLERLRGTDQEHVQEEKSLTDEHSWSTIGDHYTTKSTEPKPGPYSLPRLAGRSGPRRGAMYPIPP